MSSKFKKFVDNNRVVVSAVSKGVYSSDVNVKGRDFKNRKPKK